MELTFTSAISAAEVILFDFVENWKYLKCVTSDNWSTAALKLQGVTSPTTTLLSVSKFLTPAAGRRKVRRRETCTQSLVRCCLTEPATG